MIDEGNIANIGARALGAVLGVLASLIMVAPESTRGAFYRVLVGVTMGFIFAPVVPNLPLMGFLSGDTTDVALARSAAAGFSIWFVLEALARFMSSTDWIVRTLKAMSELRINKGGQ